MRVRAVPVLPVVLLLAACAQLGFPPASFSSWLAGYGQTFAPMGPPPGLQRPDITAFADEAGVPQGAGAAEPMYGEVRCPDVCRTGNGLTEGGVTRRGIWLLAWTVPGRGEVWVVVDANDGYSMVLGP